MCCSAPSVEHKGKVTKKIFLIFVMCKHRFSERVLNLSIRASQTGIHFRCASSVPRHLIDMVTTGDDNTHQNLSKSSTQTLEGDISNISFADYQLTAIISDAGTIETVSQIRQWCCGPSSSAATSRRTRWAVLANSCGEVLTFTP